jgi:hypothetical protein
MSRWDRLFRLLLATIPECCFSPVDGFTLDNTPDRGQVNLVKLSWQSFPTFMTKLLKRDRPMLQRIRQARTQIEADLLISRLRAAGLHPSDLRVWPHVTLAGADLFFNVEVPDEEIGSAEEIIRTADDEREIMGIGHSHWIVMRIAIALIIAAIAMGVLIP